MNPPRACSQAYGPDVVVLAAPVADQDAPLMLPIGIVAHPRMWDVPEERVVELESGRFVSPTRLITGVNGDLE